MSKTQSTTKRDVVLLISVPLLLLMLLAAIVYVPRLLARPAHDFIYSTCDTYFCDGRMAVENGTVVYQPSSRSTTDQQPSLRYYDVSTGSSRHLSIGEANRYQLDTSSRSPDGYVFTHESSSSGFLFWGTSSSEWVLKNGLFKKSVDITASDNSYDRTILFVGWVR